MPKKYLITLSDENERKLKVIIRKRQDRLDELGTPVKLTPTSVVQSMVERAIYECDNMNL